jgi:hypothetical protein
MKIRETRRSTQRSRTMKIRLGIAFAILLSGSAVLAQGPAADTAPPARGGMMQGSRGAMMQGSMMPGGMQGMQNMGPMLGQHMLPVVITAINGKTGLVEATAEGLALKLHFPPAALAGLKSGDKITVHLAFQKG